MKMTLIFNGPAESAEFVRPVDRCLRFKKGEPTEIEEDEGFVKYLLADHGDKMSFVLQTTKKSKENG